MRKISLLAILLLCVSEAFAGGFRVSLQGVRQAALGAQGAALTGDASVMFYNPAALAFVDSKWSIALGGFGVDVTAKYQNRSTLETAETNNPIGTPIYGGISYKPTDNLALGVGITTPYGSKMVWGDEWSGKYVINEIALRAFFIQPTISYKFNDWFALGGGAIIAKGAVNIQREVAVAGNDVSLEIDAEEASGWGMNLGVFIKPTDKMNIGLSYRSKVKMEVEEGTVNWENTPSIVANNLPFTTTNFKAQLPLPAEMLFGVNYMVTPKLMLGGEIGVARWGAYKYLKIDLYNSTDSYTSISKKEFENTVNYSLGAEYQAMPNLDLRIGYKYDESPSPDKYFNPETPTVNYHAFTGGLGYKFRNLKVDIMAEYVNGEERNFYNVENNFGGDIFSYGFVYGLGLSYNFGN